MQSGTIRIIGGKWKRHHLHFPTDLSVKPTPNRIRETLFNWLQTTIEGSVCLDLFAGSGALGFEALSRGAYWVGFVDCFTFATQSIQSQLTSFKADDKGHVYTGCYSKLRAYHLREAIPDAQPINLVFLDPPFHSGLIEESVNWLETHKTILSPNALLYIECEPDLVMPHVVTQNWLPLKQKRAGQVNYSLWERRFEPQQ